MTKLASIPILLLIILSACDQESAARVTACDPVCDSGLVCEEGVCTTPDADGGVVGPDSGTVTPDGGVDAGGPPADFAVDANHCPVVGSSWPGRSVYLRLDGMSINGPSENIDGVDDSSTKTCATSRVDSTGGLEAEFTRAMNEYRTFSTRDLLVNSAMNKFVGRLGAFPNVNRQDFWIRVDGFDAQVPTTNADLSVLSDDCLRIYTRYQGDTSWNHTALATLDNGILTSDDFESVDIQFTMSKEDTDQGTASQWCGLEPCRLMPLMTMRVHQARIKIRVTGDLDNLNIWVNHDGFIRNTYRANDPDGARSNPGELASILQTFFEGGYWINVDEDAQHLVSHYNDIFIDRNTNAIVPCANNIYPGAMSVSLMSHATMTTTAPF